MTVILVLVTFLAFIVLDYVLNRGKRVVTVPATAARAVPAHVSGEMVDGFLVPANLSYHPGHAWLARERKGVIRVGADEFAASLVGKVEKIELPKPGQWIRQGQKVLTLYRDGEKTEMVSPTEGEVFEINAEVLNNPALLRQDPYGNGWLMTLSVPDEENTSRNLIPKGLLGCAMPSNGYMRSNRRWREWWPLTADAPLKIFLRGCRTLAGTRSPANFSSRRVTCEAFLHFWFQFC